MFTGGMRLALSDAFLEASGPGLRWNAMLKVRVALIGDIQLTSIHSAAAVIVSSVCARTLAKPLVSLYLKNAPISSASLFEDSRTKASYIDQHCGFRDKSKTYSN